MDEILRRLQEMYDGDAADGSHDKSPVRDNSELESMRRTRQLVNSRLPKRPRQESIEVLMRAARTAPSVRRSPDRSARSLLRGVEGRLPRALALVLTVVVVSSLFVGRVKHQEAANDQLELALEANPPHVGEKVEREEPTRAGVEAQERGSSTVAEADAAPAVTDRPRAARTSPPGPTVRAEAWTEAVDEVLAWDQSDDVWELYQRVEQLSFVSPKDASWRASVQRPLVAPVGLTQTRYVSAE